MPVADPDHNQAGNGDMHSQPQPIGERVQVIP